MVGQLYVEAQKHTEAQVWRTGRNLALLLHLHLQKRRRRRRRTTTTTTTGS
jgi:hypothetical protein